MERYRTATEDAAQIARDMAEMHRPHPAGLSASRELAMALAYVASEGAGVSVALELGGEWGEERRVAA